MKHLLTTLFIFCSLFSKGQNPLVKMWDKRFGGTNNDFFYSFQQTADGGYILGGYSNSTISGDKTQAAWAGNADYWIVKIDSLGNKQWDKVFGGIDADELQSIQQTADGGYILGGTSPSGISGDKTQATWGAWDYWIVKTDSLGNKQWDKDFGGTDDDELYSLHQTADGGYILGGYSYSGISGDKTQATWGGYDFWIVKTDSLGNKQWDKDLGGSGTDFFYSIQQTTDGGYILGGCSTSGISGDKTQATWGSEDYWIVKIDSLGNKQWDKDFGGIGEDYIYHIQQTTDGGYLLGGSSASGISGDKTQATWGSEDYWIVKIDSLGNKQWDKDFGGTGEEELCKVSQTRDGGYLLSGDSYSPISGDKAENNMGTEQTWVVKTDSLGNKQWDKTIFTSGHDEQGLAIQTRDECYAMANSTAGGIAGYKSQPPWYTSLDYWLVKFCDTTGALPIVALTTTQNLCPGTCTNFVNVTFNATSYQWNFVGASPDTSTAVNPQSICYANPGSYDVQLIAFNANGSDTLLLTNYINVFPSPPPQSITQSGDTLFAIAGAGTYQWYFNSNIINGATDYFYVAQASGDYNVVATDMNGCEVEAVMFNVIAGISSTVDSGLLTIFPNPVGDKITIQKSHPDSYRDTRGTAQEISVYNMIGEKMSVEIPSVVYQNQSSEINVQSLSPGLYYLEIKTSEKNFRSKFVKQ